VTGRVVYLEISGKGQIFCPDVAHRVPFHIDELIGIPPCDCLGADVAFDLQSLPVRDQKPNSQKQAVRIRRAKV
jgi:hypothetical protein